MAGSHFSSVAAQQIDQLKTGVDVELYNAVLDACELVFDSPDRARRHSSAVTTHDGVLYRLPVVGDPPYKVFWSASGPRIEAVFPHP